MQNHLDLCIFTEHPKLFPNLGMNQKHLGVFVKMPFPGYHLPENLNL